MRRRLMSRRRVNRRGGCASLTSLREVPADRRKANRLERPDLEQRARAKAPPRETKADPL